MLAGAGNRFCWSITRPSDVATLGTSVTPGASNVEGSWTEIVSDADVTTDVYALQLEVRAGSTSGQAKNHLLDIGIDPAGGTSYAAIISNIVCGGTNTAAGKVFYFPFRIPSGSAIAVRVQGSNATAGTVIIGLRLYGAPTRPELAWAGQYSETIGTITNSNGVSFTPGDTGAKGSWASLGTTTRDLSAWQLGIQCDNATTVNSSYFFDLAFGDASNKHILILDAYGAMGNTETGTLSQSFAFGRVPAGATMYVRGACSGTADTGWNAVAVGIGG